MDGLKLEKWRANFETEVQNLQNEFNSFFSNKKLGEFYQLKVVEESQNLLLEIINRQALPKEIEKRLIEILYATQPEDSV